MRQVLGPGALGRPQRDPVEREVGGGIGMGNTCKSIADSCQCMTKTTTICKVISLQLIKINGKKKKTKKKKINSACVSVSEFAKFILLLCEQHSELRFQVSIPF